MPKRTLKILIVAACASELKPFIDLKQKHYYIKKETGFLAAGIGPVAASFGLSHFLEDYKPERIFAIGTAGIINKKKFGIGEIVLANTVATESHSKGLYTPTKQLHEMTLELLKNPTHRGPVPVRCFLSASDRITPSLATPRVPGFFNSLVSVYSPQEITRDETHRRILEKKYDVEHLESFAFAFVAKKFKVPIQIILGLTNFTDKNAHGDWKKNRGNVMKSLLKNIGICG